MRVGAGSTLLYRQFTARLMIPVQLLIARALLGVSCGTVHRAPTARLFTDTLIVTLMV